MCRECVPGWDPEEVVDCTTCGRRKAPRGRDVAPAMVGDLCTWECPGYDDEPRVGDLWPRER